MHQKFYHTQIDALTKEESINLFSKFLEEKQQRVIFFLNANNFIVAAKKAQYNAILGQSDLILNDGIGIKIASAFTKVVIKENLNGTDLIPKWIEIAVIKKQRIYLIGAEKKIIEQTCKILLEKYPTIIICGYHHGYFTKNEEQQIVADINKQNSEVLLVGMGTPKQEEWIARNKELFPLVKVCIGVGGFFHFISGSAKRAPAWMRKIGLEWLFRLIQEPKRLGKRYLFGIFEFGFYLIRFAFIRS